LSIIKSFMAWLPPVGAGATGIIRAQARELAVFEGDAGFHHAAVDGLHHRRAAAFGLGAIAHPGHDGLDARLVAHLHRVCA
jgi:hypothetical protein